MSSATLNPAAGIGPEQVLGVDRDKVNNALDVMPFPENTVYDVDERTYVQKTEVDDDSKDSRLQGFERHST